MSGAGTPERRSNRQRRTRPRGGRGHRRLAEKWGEETHWSAIVSLYDRLLSIAPSPIVALNGAIAIGQQAGPERGLEARRTLPGRDRLSGYPFSPAAIGELELRRGRSDEAREQFGTALALARNPMERRRLEKRMKASYPSPGVP